MRKRRGTNSLAVSVSGYRREKNLSAIIARATCLASSSANPARYGCFIASVVQGQGFARKRIIFESGKAICRAVGVAAVLPTPAMERSENRRLLRIGARKNARANILPHSLHTAHLRGNSEFRGRGR